MVDPNGTEYWGYTEYLTIQSIDFYTSLDAFSNEQGQINKDLPRAKWQVSFSDKSEKTIVETIAQYNSLSDLEAVIQMGMEQGMRITLEKLDELLASLTSEK